MEIITLRDHRIFASNCYLLLFGDAFSVIDPSVSYEDALNQYPCIADMKLQYIILTHGHVDHFWEIDSYVKMGGTVLISQTDSEIISKPNMNCAYLLRGKIDAYCGEYRCIYNGDKINVSGQIFEVIATPGHTAGSLSFLTDGFIFTGDTLFEGGVFGRYDLPTSDKNALMNSLDKLFALPDDLTVYAGHGGPTSLKMTKNAFYNYRREF